MFTRLEIPLCGGYQPLPSCFTVDAGATNLGLGNSSTFERFNVGVSKLLIPGLHFTWFLTGSLTCWVRVTRCTFLYHYMGASVFAGLAIAWLVDQGLHSYRPTPGAGRHHFSSC